MAIKKLDKEEKKWLKEFARRLTKRMRELKFTQEELASRTGVRQTTISNYVNARHMPLTYHVIRIARVLDMEVCDLIDF